ncbi:MAG: glycosyltransferase [Ktedonobacteraceae bacterium]
MYENDLAPIRVLEIEIGQPLLPVSAKKDETGQYYRSAICLIRLHTRPLGVVSLQLEDGRISANECAKIIWRTLHTEINEHLQQDGLPVVSELGVKGLSSASVPRCIEEREKFLVDAPFVSIIVPTHDRPERITDCLHSLLSLHYPQYEIIIVDNAPSTSETRDIIEQTCHDMPQVSYVRENRPGVSCARNRGILAARGEILAFTDDDVAVDRFWLVELVKAFNFTEDVMCVTGLTVPLELETPSQILFAGNLDSRGYDSNWAFTRHIFEKRKRHIHLYKVAWFGAGASMAFRATFLRSIGGFDLALGTNGLVQSGEDIAAFFKVIMHDYKLVYEPASLGYHLPRREYENLRKQIYRDGVGATAYLTKNLLEYPQLLFDLFTKVPYDLIRNRLARSSKGEGKSTYYPKELRKLLYKGMLIGPFAYLWSRWKIRSLREASSATHNKLALENESQ